MSEKRENIHTVIPAQPGWSLVDFTYDEDDDVDGYDLRPILAWKIITEFITSRDGNGSWVSVYPITTEGDEKGLNQEFWIKRPDGVFECPFSEFTGDERELLKLKNEQVRLWKERKRLARELSKEKKP